MTQRLRPPRRFGRRTAPGDTPPYGDEFLAVPAVPSPEPPVDDDGQDLTIFGFPAVAGPDDPRDGAADAPPGELDNAVHLVTERRADPVAGVALLLAGVAAAASLWFHWIHGEAATGLGLVRGSVMIAGAGVAALGRSGGSWEPLAIVLGGVLLLPLGVLLFIPSRTHRTMGLLALCLAIAVTAGVLARVGQAHWSPAAFDRGLWCAIGAAVLGLVGALKAMMTVPRVTVRVRSTVPQ